MRRLSMGLWPVMLTPFKNNYQIDESALEELTEFYLATGANGLFANCLSSEMFQLTDEERLQITRTVVRAVKQRVPVVSTGTFSNDHSKNREFIKKIYDTGVNAVVINSNQLVDKTEDEAIFKLKLEKLIESTDEIPLGIYECPVPYKRLISKDIMKMLGESGRFLYLKDTSCVLEQIRNKIKLSENTPLGLYNANTPTALESLKIGAQGISPVGANFYPELYQFIIQKHKLDNEKVEEVNALISVLDSIADNCYYPLSSKLFLQKRGLKISTICRTSVPSYDQQDFLKLEAMEKIIRKKYTELGFSFKY